MKNSYSIITVVFNNCQTILDTLRSVQAQGGVLEHLIIDGGSTDDTLEIIHQEGSPLVKVLSEPDEGIYDAMNKGIRLASGDIIAFLNSDDIYFDNSILENVRLCFDRDLKLEIVYGDLVYVKKDNTNNIVRSWTNQSYHSVFFEDGNVPAHPSFFVKRKALVETQGFDLQFQIAADYELMFRLLKIEARTSLYYSGILVRMRLGGESNKSLKNIIRGNQEIVRTWKKHEIQIPWYFWFCRYYQKVRQFL